MRQFAAHEIDAALDFPSLIDALALEAFRGGFHAPLRSHHTIERPGEAAATMLLMPAWTQLGGDEDFLGAKIVNVFPGNGARPYPRSRASTRCNPAITGTPLATLDGTRLTRCGGAPPPRPRSPRAISRPPTPSACCWSAPVRSRPSSPAPTQASGQSRPLRCGTIAPRALAGSPPPLIAEGWRAEAVEHLQDAVSRAPTSFHARRCR